MIESRLRLVAMPALSIFALTVVSAFAEQPVAAMPTAGSYLCTGGSAGNMKLRFGPGTRYANEKGKAGEFAVATDGEMSFTSGPWEGFFARKLTDEKVGLTSRSGQSFYYMTCDLQKAKMK